MASADVPVDAPTASKAIAATTRSPTEMNFVAAASNRSWRDATPNTAAASAHFAGSSSARSVGSISFVDSGCAANDAPTFTKHS